MKELVQFIVKSLVDHPDQVEVVEVQGPALTIIELSVAAETWGG